MRLRRACLMDAEKDDEAKRRGRNRVSNEEDEEVVICNQPGEKGRDRRAQIDRPVVVTVSARPRFGWDKICNRRAHRRAVEIGKESDDKRTERNKNKTPRQSQRDHKDRRDEETHQHPRTAAETVGKSPAAQLRDKRTCTEERNH